MNNIVTWLEVTRLNICYSEKGFDHSNNINRSQGAIIRC